jgi:steroid 5-alpha reductase family enzyme
MNYYLTIALVLFVYMNFWFIVSVLKNRNDVADIAWGLGFVVLTWTGGIMSGFSHRAILVNLLITVWGTRLAWHIFQRVLHHSEDPRYLAWRNEWKLFYLRSYFQIYLLQGVFLYLIALPALLINHAPLQSLGIADGLGMAVWIIGFCFEAIGDMQLKQFLADPAHKGKIMDQGLWKYSRHPNYFGEVTQWWGIFIIALRMSNGILTIVGPLTITGLILFVSGVPILEKKYAGREDFELYKSKTSVFIPFPPKN